MAHGFCSMKTSSRTGRNNCTRFYQVANREDMSCASSTGTSSNCRRRPSCEHRHHGHVPPYRCVSPTVNRAFIFLGIALLAGSIPLLLNGFVSYAPVARGAFMYRHQEALLYAGVSMVAVSAIICLAASVCRHRKSSLNDMAVAIGYNAALVSVAILALISWLLLAKP